MFAFLSKIPISKKMIGYIVATAVVTAVAVWAYKKYVKPGFEQAYIENNEFEAAPANADTAILYLFHTEWCPHCKKAMPEWNAVKRDLRDGEVNGVKVVFREVDCDADEETAARFGVESYPTIKLVRGNRITELDAKPTVASINSFLSDTL
jgi:thiol-disulfide isomerase/thioredoxin